MPHHPLISVEALFLTELLSLLPERLLCPPSSVCHPINLIPLPLSVVDLEIWNGGFHQLTPDSETLS